MGESKFNAYIVEEQKGAFKGQVKSRMIGDLPPGDLLVRVHYSSLNYKDALSSSGNKGVTKAYPHTPGIDAAGKVVACETGLFKEGDAVIVTGYDLGMNTDGGFGQYIRVPSEWAVGLPDNLSMKEAMILGTAGFTAGLSVLKLSELVKPEHGKIIVSGATGGVGVLSISILRSFAFCKR